MLPSEIRRRIEYWIVGASAETTTRPGCGPREVAADLQVRFLQLRMMNSRRCMRLGHFCHDEHHLARSVEGFGLGTCKRRRTVCRGGNDVSVFRMRWPTASRTARATGARCNWRPPRKLIPIRIYVGSWGMPDGSGRANCWKESRRRCSTRNGPRMITSRTQVVVRYAETDMMRSLSRQLSAVFEVGRTTLLRNLAAYRQLEAMGIDCRAEVRRSTFGRGVCDTITIVTYCERSPCSIRPSTGPAGEDCCDGMDGPRSSIAKQASAAAGRGGGGVRKRLRCGVRNREQYGDRDGGQRDRRGGQRDR